MTEVKTFLMIGRPGSGKGTQGNLLAQKIGARVYSSGSRLRDMAATGSYFGHRAKEVMDRGDLMPVWVSQFLFEEALVLLAPQEAIVFEGSCRIVDEAMRFHEAATWLERPYTAVYIDASHANLRERLIKRAALEGRTDDHIETLDKRFQNFTNMTMKSVEYFDSVGRLVRVDGDQSIDAVHKDILKVLNLQ
jgi:adenylate kinase